MSGISALTYGAAKAITEQKVESAAQAPAPAAAAASPTKSQAAQSQWWTDLFRNDEREFDLGDTQMFFFILLAVAMFLLNSFHSLGWLEYAKNITLPDVDTTLLSSIGLSQGAYLAKKAASALGKG